MDNKEYDTLLENVDKVNTWISINPNYIRELEDFETQCNEMKKRVDKEYKEKLLKIEKLNDRIEAKRRRRQREPFTNEHDILTCKEYVKSISSPRELISHFLIFTKRPAYGVNEVHHVKIQMIYESKKAKYLDEYNEKLENLCNRCNKKEFEACLTTIKELSCMMTFDMALTQFKLYSKQPYLGKKENSYCLTLTTNPYDIKDGKEVLRYTVSNDIELDPKVFYLLNLIYHTRG